MFIEGYEVDFEIGPDFSLSEYNSTTETVKLVIDALEKKLQGKRYLEAQDFIFIIEYWDYVRHAHAWFANANHLLIPKDYLDEAFTDFTNDSENKKISWRYPIKPGSYFTTDYYGNIKLMVEITCDGSPYLEGIEETEEYQYFMEQQIPIKDVTITLINMKDFTLPPLWHTLDRYPAWDCSETACMGECTDVCTGTCSGTCTSTCTGTCSSWCRNECEASCGLECSSTCDEGDCHGYCKGGCIDNCAYDTCEANCAEVCYDGCGGDEYARG